MDAIRRGLADPAGDVVTGALNNSLTAILSGLTDQLHAGILFLSATLAGWILVPSTQVCPTTTVDWINTCAASGSPAAQVRGWLLPATALVAVLGVLWQAITMTISRKGEPLLTVLKGLFSIALWGAVGIAGTQLALRAGDAYAYWILKQAIFGDSTNPTGELGSAIASMSAGQSYTAVLVLILLQIPFLFATAAQIILMIFREGAVVILAGQLQLAAAGGLTRLTSGWLAKLTGWMLALICYKPIAATIYAVAFALMGDGIRDLLMGLAVMIMALIAMPALMRFFNWSVGTVAHHGNGLGMLGTTFAAGLHGASAVRGLGGYGAADHARWLDTHGPTNASGTAPSSMSPSGAATTVTPGAASGAAGGASPAGAATAGAATAGAATAATAAADAVQHTVQRAVAAADDATAGS
jgi:hypothetical protein